MSDSTKTIWESAQRFFSGTLLSRISGMLRDIAMAYVFGAEAAIAAFMLAFRLAHLLRRLFGEGALQSAFIPHFEALRHTDEKQAYAFFRHLSLLLAGTLGGIILILSFILGGVLAWGDLSSSNYEVVLLTLLMLPSLLFICLYGLNASLLQCEKFFFTSSAAPLAFNGIWILAVISLRDWSAQEAMPVLALSVILACFLQWIWTVPCTLNILRKGGKTPAANRFAMNLSSLIKLSKPLALGMLGVASSQINNAVDSLFARYAELEGPAILWYAIRLQQLPLALFGIALSGALLPPLSRAIKSLDWERYYHFLEYAIMRTIGFMLPITGLIFCIGDASVNLIYGRGDFNDQAIWQTTRCLWAYGIGLIPSALILILAPAYYSQSNYKLPALTSVLAMLLNLILNSLFILVFQWGAMSVALATSISAWINFFVLFSYIGFAKHLSTGNLILSTLKFTLITGMACLGVWGFKSGIQGSPFLLGSEFLWPRNFSTQFLEVLYPFCIFIFIWVITKQAFNMKQFILKT